MDFSLIDFLGRLLVGAWFLYFGVANVRNWQPLADQLRQKSIPLPTISIWLGIALQVLCALLLIVGVQRFLAGLLLLIGLIFTTFMLQQFWRAQGEQKSEQLHQFFTNLAIMGALLLAM